MEYSKKYKDIKQYLVHGLWNGDMVYEAVGKGWITESEYEKITGVQYDKQISKEDLIEDMSVACNSTIISGVDVTLSDGNTYHYSLTIEDQINLMNLQSMVVSGAEMVPYHADGEECRYYSADDFNIIVQAATRWKMYHESYFNSLRGYIQSLESEEDLKVITYGMDIPEEYQTDVLKSLIAAESGA